MGGLSHLCLSIRRISDDFHCFSYMMMRSFFFIFYFFGVSFLFPLGVKGMEGKEMEGYPFFSLSSLPHPIIILFSFNGYYNFELRIFGWCYFISFLLVLRFVYYLYKSIYQLLKYSSWWKYFSRKYFKFPWDKPPIPVTLKLYKFGEARPLVEMSFAIIFIPY